MLPVILSNGLGIDSEELGLFINEKIADLTLAERILLILASEGFDEAFLIADIPKISFNRLNKKFPGFKIHQSNSLTKVPRETDILILQNNVVINKKQFQSTLKSISDTEESVVIGQSKNCGIVFMKGLPSDNLDFQTSSE